MNKNFENNLSENPNQNKPPDKESSEDEIFVLDDESEKEEEVLILEEGETKSTSKEEEILVLEEKPDEIAKIEQVTPTQPYKETPVEKSPEIPQPQPQTIEQPEALEKEFEEYITKEAIPQKEEVKIEEKPAFDIPELKKKIISLEGSGELFKVRESLKDLLEIRPEDEWAKLKLSETNRKITATYDTLISKLKGLLSTGKFEEIEIELSQVPPVIKEEEGFQDFQQTYETIKKSHGFQKQGKVRKAIKLYTRALHKIEGLLWVQEQLAQCIILLETKRKKYKKFWIILSIIILICGGGVFGVSFYLENELYFFIGVAIIGTAIILFLFGLLTSTLIGSVKPQNTIIIKNAK